jgi:hypothetical protein
MGEVFRFLNSNMLHYLKHNPVLLSNTRQYVISLKIFIPTSSLGSYFILTCRRRCPREPLSFHLLTKPFRPVIYASLTANFNTNSNLLLLFIHNSFSVQMTATFASTIQSLRSGSFLCRSHNNVRNV